MDQWLLFHGSSNIYEESIRKEGLCPSALQFDLQDLQKVEAIFEALYWFGIHSGGFAVLQPFSIMHDHGHKEGKPIYLAESAQRASLFATKDFAGGEICRAMHYCIEDLNRYVKEKRIREEHVSQLERQPGFERVERSAIPEFDWVCSEVEALKTIKEKVEDIRSSFEYGVIYSVRLNRNNLSKIHCHTSMGIKSYRSIDVTEIEEIYTLPPTFQKTIVDDKKRLNAVLEAGIVRTIMERASI